MRPEPWERQVRMDSEGASVQAGTSSEGTAKAKEGVEASGA